MAIPIPNIIDELKSTIGRRNGLARSNRFLVRLTPPIGGVYKLDTEDLRDLSILCESCSLPTRSITTVDYKLLRHSIKIANGYTNSDVSFTFNLTGDYLVKKVFDLWIGQIININQYSAAYVNKYTAVVDIQQLDSFGLPIYAVKLLDAYPLSVQSISLDNNSSDSTQKITVDFTYRDYEVIF